jgi:hypothetical protein
MFTSMILVCQLQACTVVYSTVFYATEEGCKSSQVNGGIDFVRSSFPNTDYIEGYCHEWVGPDKSSPT